MSGGQATNSGIDFQQRVAAWYLIHLYSESDLRKFHPQLDVDTVIQSVNFESESEVDDINLICSNCEIHIQAKRSISLSVRANSEFYKAVKQFLSSYFSNPDSKIIYHLTVSHTASRKITSDLSKIIESIKINPKSFADNPLSESEKDTLDKFRSICNEICKEIKKVELDNKSWVAFINRLQISAIGIEQSSTFEMAALTLLASLQFTNPELIWSLLIRNSLSYSKQRQSINRDELKSMLDKYKSKPSGESINNTDEIKELFKSEVFLKGILSTGKEVVLIESFLDEVDLLVCECYRFHDDCKKKHTFRGDEMIIREDIKWKVIQRFSSLTGFERFANENDEIFKENKLAILPAKDIDGVEETNCAKDHQELLKTMYKQNENPHLCLHCTKPIGEEFSTLVEVDDLDSIHSVGAVHNYCVRPIDRILGRVQIPGKAKSEVLNSFDGKLWIELLFNGQGMLNYMRNRPNLLQGRIPIISWSSDDEYDSDYSYCVKYKLEDGTIFFANNRSRIHRMNLREAEDFVEMVIEMINKQEELNDPYCALSISKVSNPYSGLIKHQQPDEEILKIVDVQVAKYSSLIKTTFDSEREYYTPMCILRDKKTETYINLSNVVPLISNPIEIDKHVNNWSRLGFELDDIELKIIKSDRDFDSYMRMAFEAKMSPIIDPLFDKDFKLISGMPIRRMDDLITEAESRR